MNISSIRPRTRGFTLVELLVVIAIIMVLAGAGFAAGNAAMQRARKAKAQAVASSLATAVENFYSEYGALPDTGNSAPVDTSRSTDLLNILLGAETVGNPQNPRAIKFLTAKEGKAKKDGLIYRGNQAEGLYDPWGNGYVVVMDTLYEDSFQVLGTTIRGKKVAVYSVGPDGEPNTSDDVKTW